MCTRCRGNLTPIGAVLVEATVETIVDGVRASQVVVVAWWAGALV